MNRVLSSKWTKVVVFLLSLVPLFYLLSKAYAAFRGSPLALTANPLEYITHFTGDWTIRFIMITLAITPLRMLLKRPAITRYRRMLGLFAFFYGSLHLLTWLWFDRQFQWEGTWEDIRERLYITVGMSAWLMMLPLALTSTARAVRRLGFKRWKALHRLIYGTAVAAVIHYYWLVKSDVRDPLLYAGILAVLMAYRLAVWLRDARRVASRRAKPASVEAR